MIDVIHSANSDRFQDDGMVFNINKYCYYKKAPQLPSQGALIDFIGLRSLAELSSD